MTRSANSANAYNQEPIEGPSVIARNIKQMKFHCGMLGLANQHCISVGMYFVAKRKVHQRVS